MQLSIFIKENMLISDKDFIKYYDKIFYKKDYSEETNYILERAKSFGKWPINNILDLGCGTGSHTIEFEKLGYNIKGLDIDPLMIEMAKSKNNSIDFIYGDIENTNFNKQFDLIYSFFNVVNYINDINTLTNFFKGVYDNLEKTGIFVFDGWNGNRICLEPTKKKELNIQLENFHAKVELNPNYDEFYNNASFKYKIDINDNSHKVKYENVLPQTYWSPLLLKQLLNQIGFVKIIISDYLSDKPASFEDYKICWVCVK